MNYCGVLEVRGVEDALGVVVVVRLSLPAAIAALLFVTNIMTLAQCVGASSVSPA